MNKRKKKKLRKKRELFVTCFASSYREVKEMDKSYHEFVLVSQRKQRYMKQHNIKSTDTVEF